MNALRACTPEVRLPPPEMRLRPHEVRVRASETRSSPAEVRRWASESRSSWRELRFPVIAIPLEQSALMEGVVTPGRVVTPASGSEFLGRHTVELIP